MGKSDTPITFKATLQKPAEPKGAGWAFLVLPKAASAKLPTRSMVTVDGVLGAATFTYWLSWTICREDSTSVRLLAAAVLVAGSAVTAFQLLAPIGVYTLPNALALLLFLGVLPLLSETRRHALRDAIRRAILSGGRMPHASPASATARGIPHTALLISS